MLLMEQLELITIVEIQNKVENLYGAILVIQIVHHKNYVIPSEQYRQIFV